MCTRVCVCLLCLLFEFSSSLQPLPLPLAGSPWLMSNEGTSKKRRRSSSNDDESHRRNSKRGPSTDYTTTTTTSLNPSSTVDIDPAVPTTPLIVDSSTPGDTMPDDDNVPPSFAPAATGAPPATTHAQPTPPLSASMPRCDVPYVSPRQKWDQVSNLKFTAMKDGDPWYLISLAWHEKWKAACNPAEKTQGREADEQLGPVDNSDIVDTNGELIPALSEGNRVTSVSQRVMDLFTEWYMVFCIPLLYLAHAHAPPIAGTVLQSIPSHAKSSPRENTWQSALNSILTK